MRLIDAEKLNAVLQNIKEHLEESRGAQSVGMAALFAYVMQIVDIQPSIDPPPNDPLTLEELREMDGDPVWLECLEPGMGHLSCWGIVNSDCVDGYHTNYCYTDYGDNWLAYRRKLEM